MTLNIRMIIAIITDYQLKKYNNSGTDIQQSAESSALTIAHKQFRIFIYKS